MGEIAALFTSICYTFGSSAFTVAGKRTNPTMLNRIRLVLSIVFLMITHLLLTGTLFPIGFSLQRWSWFGLSGIFGLVLGDSFLFMSFNIIGTSLTMLIYAASPVLSTILAWFLYNEHLSFTQIIGILFTFLGIVIVILIKNDNRAKPTARKKFVIGLVFAFLAMVGQTLGLIFAKDGLSDGFNSLSGSLIRMVCATIVMWGIAIFTKQFRTTVSEMTKKKTMLPILIASFSGPFLGVWFSLIAVQTTDLGIASALMSITPIFLLPIEKWYFKNHIHWAAIIGTLLSVSGVIILLQY